MAFDAETLRLGHGAADFAPPRRTAREPQAAHFLPGNRLTGFLFKTVEHGNRILHEPREIALSAQLPDEARRMPGAAVGELRLVDQQHVLGAIAGQMIGKRCADGPAADNQDTDMTIRVELHDFTLAFVGS